MTKGNFFAVLIHCAGVAFAVAICLGFMKVLIGTVSDDVLTGAAIFYSGSVAWVTVRVLRGQDAMANAVKAFIDRSEK